MAPPPAEAASPQQGAPALEHVPPPPPPTLSTTTTTTCRICWEGEDDSPGGHLLLGTCRCSGSLAAVHARCLMEWQQQAVNPGTCATCCAAITIPASAVAAAARAARCPHMWLQGLKHEFEQLRCSPLRTVFRWWNLSVMATGVAHAALFAQRAWLQAPAANHRLLQQAPLHRWQLLPTVACAAAYQVAWGPNTVVGGFAQGRWLMWHALSFAAGLLLECCALQLQQTLGPAAAVTGAAAGGAPAAAAAGGAVAGMRAAASLLPLLLGPAALLLQAAGLQHLHPFLKLVQGYQLGVARALHWTGQLLLLPLLGCGGGRGRAVAQACAAVARLLPFLGHGLFRALNPG